MSVITERGRRELYERAEASWGKEAADLLMELLPPVGWSEVATKADLAMLRAELHAVEKSLKAEIQTLRAEIQGFKGELQGLRGEIVGLRGEFHRDNAKMFRNLVVMNFTMVLAMGFGMARLLG